MRNINSSSIVIGVLIKKDNFKISWNKIKDIIIKNLIKLEQSLNITKLIFLILKNLWPLPINIIIILLSIIILIFQIILY